MITLKSNELDGRRIAYSSDTEFLVQIGRGRGSYRTKFVIHGDLPRAVLLFNAVNIGYGHKKRLVSWGMNRPILARQFSA